MLKKSVSNMLSNEKKNERAKNETTTSLYLSTPTTTDYRRDAKR